jgi:two-component system, cell cycle response regulator DivK
VKDILVVEDNPVNRELIREILEAQGYSVVEAQDGAEAIAMLREKTPTVAIIDIQMPKVSGLELIKLIREDERLYQTKCLALTAYAMSGDKDKLLRSGFDAYLTKPFESRELVRTIEVLSAG